VVAGVVTVSLCRTRGAPPIPVVRFVTTGVASTISTVEVVVRPFVVVMAVMAVMTVIMVIGIIFPVLCAR